MKTFAIAAAAALMLAAPSLAQTGPDGASLGWLAGSRVHRGADGAVVYESFIGPVNGVVSGTALSPRPTGAYTEYHRFQRNADGVFGLSVQNSVTNAWSFAPLKSIEPGKVVFSRDNGAVIISYWDKGQGRVGASVERTADGKTTRQEWSFEPVPAPK